MTAFSLQKNGAPTQATGGLCVLFVCCAIVAGGSAVLLGAAYAAPTAVGVAVIALIAVRPSFAVYIYLATLPFLAGIDRDRLLPLVRPNEALLVVLVAGVLIGSCLRYVRGHGVLPRFRPLDVSLAVFVLLSTVWPVAWMLLRGSIPDAAELAALLPVCKLVGLLILVRIAIHSESQLIRLARVITWPAAAIAVIAVLQTTGFPPVLTLLSTYWSPGPDPTGLADRGTTTLASSIATGDYVILALALLIALGFRGLMGRREQLVLGFVLVAGTLAAGQFSTWAAAIVVGTGMLRQYPTLRRAAIRFFPAIVAAALIGIPAALVRFAEFGNGFGVPTSWLGRWDNVVSFYLPALADFRWVLGVSPNSVLEAPETWRDTIYLEFGYLQLLWVGGLPLLAAFVWLSVEVLREAGHRAVRPDAIGAYASALRAAWWVVLVLSVIDIHLVLRGAGELLFTFIAITSGRVGDR